MKLLFSEGAGEMFDELPGQVKQKAVRVIELVGIFPEMFPPRLVGEMLGYRWFTVAKYRFFYRSSSKEILIVAIVRAVMKRA